MKRIHEWLGGVLVLLRVCLSKGAIGSPNKEEGGPDSEEPGKRIGP